MGADICLGDWRTISIYTKSHWRQWLEVSIAPILCQGLRPIASPSVHVDYGHAATRGLAATGHEPRAG